MFGICHSLIDGQAAVRHGQAHDARTDKRELFDDRMDFLIAALVNHDNLVRPRPTERQRLKTCMEKLGATDRRDDDRYGE